MRRTLPTSLLVAAAMSLSGTAFAGTLSAPKSLPIDQGYLAVADMIMTPVPYTAGYLVAPLVLTWRNWG